MQLSLPVRATRALGLGAVVAATGVALIATAPSALAAASGTVHTDSGASLTVRSGPHTGSSAVGSVADGGTVSISCQTSGDTVTGKYGTSAIWDQIGSGRYVSDTYVYTGSDGRVAPDCSGGGSGGGSSTGCQNSFGNPRTCAEAVAWAEDNITTKDAGYYNLCDHVMGLAYKFPHSGSTTAYAHWQAIPAADKHAGSTDVPAGGLAFFSGGAGHVMISIGGGQFISTDIHGHGTFTKTTIAEIRSTWGKPYLGWAQPWFQANH